MESYRKFRKRAITLDIVWDYTQKEFPTFPSFLLKTINCVRLQCRVIKKFRSYKKPIEKDDLVMVKSLVEAQIEQSRIKRLENPTIKNPLYSLKIKCRFQVGTWTLEVIGLIDTRCSNTFLVNKLVPPQYHKTIPLNEQFQLNKWMKNYILTQID